jgi:hypothetical protein
MIYHYLYQNKLLKDKKLFSFEKLHNIEPKKIEFSLSILEKIFSNIKKLSLGMIYYSIEIIGSYKFFYDTYKKKNSQTNTNCIFLGNGPSLNKLKIKDLKLFKKKGHKIFAVNHWTENLKYKSIIPDYIILTDVRFFLKNTKNKILNKRDKKLIDFIHKNKNITLISPPKIIKILKNKFKNNIITYSDTEFDFLYSSNNIFLPRGYSSISLAKGIAVAKWLNFKKIFIIGIDNTYFRYLFSDKLNRILYLDIHSYKDNIIVDYTSRYKSMFDYMMDHVKVFKAYEIFENQKNIYNLDEYSLTNFFTKKKFLNS